MQPTPATTHPARRRLLGLAVLLTLLCTLFVASAAPSGAAGTGTITGKVTTDAGRPVARAWVQIGPPVADALTASDGSFTLTGVPFGGYRIRVLSPCRPALTAGIVVDGNETLTIKDVRDAFLFDGGTACKPTTMPARPEIVGDLGLRGDDVARSMSIGFDFPYLGKTRPSVIVSSNGYLSFGPDDGTRFKNLALDDPTATPQIFAAFWDDLLLDEQSSVLTGVGGATPNRHRMIEWRDVALLTQPSLRVTVTVDLFETGRIVVRWSGIDPTSELERGSSATIGFLGLDPSTAARTPLVEQSFEVPSLSNGLTVEYTRNDPPVAKAGPDRTVARGTAVTLDGSGSTDPQGKTGLKHRWTQVSGPATPITNAGTAKASITTPKAKTTLTYRLTVTDPFGRTATDSVKLTVP